MTLMLSRIIFLLNVGYLVLSWPDFIFYPKNIKEVSYNLTSNESLEGKQFDPTLPTVFIVHGFTYNAFDKDLLDIKNQLKTYANVNVIMVDWKDGAWAPTDIDLIWYSRAASNIKKVSAGIVEFIRSNEIDPTRVTCIGHSLGAHACGFVGKNLTNLARISGIDPAGPFFRSCPAERRLNASDAALVDCMFTSPICGIVDPICKVNFYMNGGVFEQPMCFFMDEKCKHISGLWYYAESIKTNNTCKFYASKCTQEKWGQNKCDNCTQPTNCIQMGFYADKYPNASGSYYLKTKEKRPYCVV